MVGSGVASEEINVWTKGKGESELGCNPQWICPEFKFCLLTTNDTR